MKIPGRQSPSFLRVVFRLALLALAGLTTLLAIWLVLASRMEARWTAYAQEAARRGQPMALPPIEAPIPEELNLAAGPPFAPVPVDAKGEFKEPGLGNDWLPKELVPDVRKYERIQLATARDALPGEPVDKAGLAEVILRLCDEQMAEWWPRILAAEARPQASFRVRYWPLPQAEKIPFKNVRVVEQIHAARAVALQRLGRGREALAEIHGGLRLAEAHAADPSLVALMIRAASVGLQMHVIWEGLAADAWPEADLAALDRELAGLCVSKDWARAMDAERGWQNEVYNSLAGGGVAERSAWMKKYWETNAAWSTVLALAAQRGVIRDNQLLVNQHFDAVRQRFDVAGNWHEAESPFSYDGLSRMEKAHYLLASLTIADYERAERRLRGAETLVRQARIAVALERFRRLHRVYPAELAELTPAFLSSIPADPVGGSAMRYAAAGPDLYSLHSIAADWDEEEETSAMALEWPGGKR